MENLLNITKKELLRISVFVTRFERKMRHQMPKLSACCRSANGSKRTGLYRSYRQEKEDISEEKDYILHKTNLAKIKDLDELPL